MSMGNMLKGLSNLKEPIQALTKEIEAMKEELKKQTSILEEVRDNLPTDEYKDYKEDGKTYRDD